MLNVVPQYQPRFVSRDQGAELVNLYHLARTALAGERERGRWARMNWAAVEFNKVHPEITIVAAYKDLDGLLS